MPEPPHFDQITRAMQAFRVSVERSTVALNNFGAVYETMRREHPEWFDPETGYLNATR